MLEGTVLYRSNLPPMAWFYAMLLMANSSIGMRTSFLRKQLGLGIKSTARLGLLIRLHMASCDRPNQLGGPGKIVYVDEALVPYVKRGRGALQQRTPLIVMGFACEDQVISGFIPNRTSTTFLAAINRFVRPGSVIITDGHASYKGLRSRGWQHVVVNHSVAFHDFRGNTLNPIETYWRVLKRTAFGYRQFDSENAWLYLAEVEFRYNRRRSGVALFESLIGRFEAIGREERLRLERCYDWRLCTPRGNRSAPFGHSNTWEYPGCH
ncbi:hypothetical protein GCM10011515_23810 [Tsuneonella deserti]|uniref:ISXO2-like transposase domain-containing protein n=1 Tax=Tsuneonella deserti TaxID=2035528 RepID=A0ABQ1S9S3_9SPHN|nr:IS1595 family transposase [Tsuneonella deserti]GGE03496.1 hypothetical protein GCM10011515_23810 [Tsuneonella deserti]